MDQLRLTTRLLPYVELSRPLNGVITLVSVLLGAMFALKDELEAFMNLDALTAGVSAVLLLSAGNAINDYYDSDIDRINKPQRPIPRGRIQRKNVRIFAITLIVMGIALGAFVNRHAGAIAIGVSICLIAYARWLKRTPIAGNFVVGLLTGLTFITGGVAVESLHGTFAPATFALLFTTAREIVKDLEDVEGDSQYAAYTIAVISKPFAVLMAIVFMASVILFSPIPYLLDWYPWYYLVLVVIGVDFVLICLAFHLWKDSSKESSAKVQKWMKWDIFVGIGVIYIGSFV